MIGHLRMHNLLKALQKFWVERRRDVDGRFRRTLPFGDYIVDRWVKARELGFGEGTSVYDSCVILGDVVVGRDTWIGPFTVLDGSGGLEIGSNCAISAGVQLYSHDTVRRCITGGVELVDRARTVIGSNCYLGPNVVVGKGVTIGDGVVIGANSLVLESVPSGVFAAGSPCRVIGSSDRFLRRP